MPTDPVTLTTAAPPSDSLDLQGIRLHAETDVGPAGIDVVEPAPGVLEVHVTAPPAAATLALDWDLCTDGATVYWQPDWAQRRHMPAEWASRRSVSLLRSVPVGSLVDAADRNVASWALSETSRRIQVRREGIREESARFRCSTTVPVPTGEAYEVVLRIDRRPVAYWTALADIATWWDGFFTEPPMPAAPAGRMPTYCTWYAMHQELTADRVERAAEQAYALGFRTIIVDDGWQTDDTSRGYWYCGEWETATGKMGVLADHVARVRREGVTYLLWLAPSLLGRRSPARARFADRVLGSLSAQDADILDPRYPEVRDHLTEVCVRLLDTAGVDGFKLDFLDAWLVDDPPPAGAGADVPDVESAVVRWLTELRDELALRRPDVLLEFRQNYTGPALQRFGNLFRAADCPMDIVDNRTRTVDVRLLLPGRVVHSDPILWNTGESAVYAAEQLLCALFSVPQVSVDLAALPDEHRRMLTYWLGFHRAHVDTLVGGAIEPSRPDLAYPLVRSRGASGVIAAAYAAVPVPIAAADGPDAVVVNGTGAAGIVVEVAPDTEVVIRTVRDHCGEPVAGQPDRLTAGLHRLAVPRAGLAELSVRPSTT
ncbi:MAG TPA: glycoside hydrolase family 36 protein [Actinocatenispora sp.]